MEGNFQKSWSVYGYKKFDGPSHLLNRPRPNFVRNEHPFQSVRSSKINLQQRFQNNSNHGVNQNSYLMEENECPFYLRPRPQIHSGPGLRFRSLTDSNIRQFEVNGVTRSCNEPQSPKSFLPQPFQRLPERIAPILSNIQNTVSQAGPKTEKFLHKGGKKVQKAFQGVRTSINSFSQRFKKKTRRRYNLENTPTRTPTRSISHSGRVTPGKLYSPFDVNTPRTPHSYMKEPKRLQHVHPRRNMIVNDNYALLRTPPPHTPGRTYHGPNGCHNWTNFSSPSAPRPHPNFRSPSAPRPHPSFSVAHSHPNPHFHSPSVSHQPSHPQPHLYQHHSQEERHNYSLDHTMFPPMNNHNYPQRF